jgi:hypothetical protein
VFWLPYLRSKIPGSIGINHPTPIDNVLPCMHSLRDKFVWRMFQYDKEDCPVSSMS